MGLSRGMEPNDEIICHVLLVGPVVYAILSIFFFFASCALLVDYSMITHT